MSRSLNFPDKYHIIWLDKHIGDPEFCLPLKRAFFTHVDPESGDTVSLSDKDIGHSIQCNSEISANFDNFHFTFRAFVDETSCLNYIDGIQNHRILFIASSLLGQPAVEILLRRYPHSFINSKTNQPYSSIYIFCTDISKASEWAFSYLEYVKIFDFESDLLARMTRDLGEEFLDHGQQLMEANEYESAIERLSWAKSLFIRYDKLILLSESKRADQATEASTTTEQRRVSNPPSTPIKQSRPSQKSIHIDQLLNIAEERMKQQSENNSDQVSKVRDRTFDPI
jgi:hypothetical protein